MLRHYRDRHDRDLADIPADLDLIENRLIDSLTFIEFLVFLEELTGQPIDQDNLRAADFRTLAAIEAKFLKAVG
jgi:acyl carrier protein